MVPVCCVERADAPWIWCVLGLRLLAKRKADHRREDGSEYNISTSHNLSFFSVVLAFSDFSLARRPALENFRVAPRTREGPGSIIASQFRPSYAIFLRNQVMIKIATMCQERKATEKNFIALLRK